MRLRRSLGALVLSVTGVSLVGMPQASADDLTGTTTAAVADSDAVAGGIAPTGFTTDIGGGDITGAFGHSGRYVGWQGQSLGDRVERRFDRWWNRDAHVLDAWIAQGVTFNGDRPNDRFNGPLTFNDRSNEYLLHQAYISAAWEPTDHGDHWDFGGRVDALWGSDYVYATAVGLETHKDGTPKWNGDGPRRVNGERAALYGVALPQLYADIYAPVAEGIDIQVGHFYSIVNEESVMAPANFFYSRSYMFQYGEPKTHTGVLGSYDTASGLELAAGWTRGWDVWTSEENQNGFLGRIGWSSCDDRTQLAFALHTGDDVALTGVENRTMYSLIFRQRRTTRFSYVLQWDYGRQENGELSPNGDITSAKWYGLVGYFFYDITPDLTFGFRTEWFRDQDNSRVASFPIDEFADGGNYYEMTLGLRWQPCEWVIVRPEIRFDWSDFHLQPPFNAVRGPYDDSTDKHQTTIAADVIVRF